MFPDDFVTRELRSSPRARVSMKQSLRLFCAEAFLSRIKLSVKTSSSSARWLASLVLALTLAAFAALSASACANGAEPNAPPGFDTDASDVSSPSDATLSADADADAPDSPTLIGDDGSTVSASTLKIQPADPVLNVTIVDGVITSAPLPF